MNTKTQPVASEPSSGERFTPELLADLIPAGAKLVDYGEGKSIGVLMDYKQIREFAAALLSSDAKPASEQEDEYFAKRPQIDCNDRRMVFRAGFAAGRASEPVAVPQDDHPLMHAPVPATPAAPDMEASE